ncbi:MAG: transporter substrate-binding domain-containing protein [Legionella longbeachae]|nr:transporter substrate-binding domain-containing protein [Legionella longbeachae]
MKHFKSLLFIVLLTGSILAYSTPIVVGVAKSTPPYSAVDTKNHYFGFCIDLINEVCKRLNETCEYKAMNVNKQMEQLNNGEFDITFSPSPITDTTAQNYMYSIPYLTSNGVFLTINPQIISIEQIKNKRIGTLQNSHLENILLAYTSQENIKTYPAFPNLLSSVLNNEVDVIIVNANLAKYLANNKIINFQVVGKPIILGNGYGIIALKKNAELIKRINTILLQMENDGTYLFIYNKYFGNLGSS